MMILKEKKRVKKSPRPWIGGVRELMRLDKDVCLLSLFSLLTLTLCIPARSTVVGVTYSDMRCTN